MDNNWKLNFINYWSYKTEKIDVEKFFDDDFIEFFRANIYKSSNPIQDILEYISLSDYLKTLNPTSKINLLTALVMRSVDISDLLQIFDVNEQLTLCELIFLELNGLRAKFTLLAKSLDGNLLRSFLNKYIKELTDMELLMALNDCYTTGSFSKLKTLLEFDSIKEITKNKISAPAFYEFLKYVTDGEKLVQERVNFLDSILVDFKNYSPDTVKRVFGDRLFHENSTNLSLDVKTIIELAQKDSSFKENLGNRYWFYEELSLFLEKFEELYYKDDFEKKLRGFFDFPECHLTMINDDYNSALNNFTNFVKDGLEHTNQNIISGLKPSVLKSSDGKNVGLFSIENQTEKQSRFNILVHASHGKGSAKEFCEKYKGEGNKRKKICCSMIDQNKLTTYGADDSVIFGYLSIKDRTITSATASDGITDGNQYRNGKRVKTIKNTLLPLYDFMRATTGHNEVSLEGVTENSGYLKPDCIIVKKIPPTQFEIDVAAYFSIPILYINELKYDMIPDPQYTEPASYDNYTFGLNVVYTGESFHLGQTSN